MGKPGKIGGKDEVKSPCIKKCSLGQNNVCPGCYRTIEEIVAWPDADDDTRRKIIEAVKLRKSPQLD